MNSFWCLISQPWSPTPASTLTSLSLVHQTLPDLSKAGFKGMWALQWHRVPGSDGPSAWSNALLSLFRNVYYHCVWKWISMARLNMVEWGRGGISCTDLSPSHSVQIFCCLVPYSWVPQTPTCCCCFPLPGATTQLQLGWWGDGVHILPPLFILQWGPDCKNNSEDLVQNPEPGACDLECLYMGLVVVIATQSRHFLAHPVGRQKPYAGSGWGYGKGDNWLKFPRAPHPSPYQAGTMLWCDESPRSLQVTSVTGWATGTAVRVLISWYCHT